MKPGNCLNDATRCLALLSAAAAVVLSLAQAALAGGAGTAPGAPLDVMLDLRHDAQGAISSVRLDGRKVFDAAKHRRLTVFERFPDRTVKRVFIYGRKVYEQTWDADGKPVGAPFIVLSPGRTSSKTAGDARQPGSSIARTSVGGGRSGAGAGRTVYRPEVIVVPASGRTASAGGKAGSPGRVSIPGGRRWNFDAIRKKVLSFEGTPYRAGGYDPVHGFKTAGLVWYFHHDLGVEVPRLLQEQATSGRLVPRSALRPGDVLVFATGKRSRPNIVGLYAGNGEMVYMSYSKRRARKVSIAGNYWKKGYVCARRFLGTVDGGSAAGRDRADTGRRRSGGADARGRRSSSSRGRVPAGGDGRLPLPEEPPFEEGYASFYGGGDGFNGTPTASGETFDHNKLTAAHKTLPFGTMVKVVRTDTGKSVVVRINDRGPFIEKRIIDLSYAAARQLGMLSKGVTRVRLYILSKP